MKIMIIILIIMKVMIIILTMIKLTAYYAPLYLMSGARAYYSHSFHRNIYHIQKLRKYDSEFEFKVQNRKIIIVVIKLSVNCLVFISFQMLMTQIGRLRYPEYKVLRKTRIFANREAVIRQV